MDDKDQWESSEGATPAGEEDDFFTYKDAVGEERRLHLAAFEFWRSLRAGRDLPLFRDLTAEGLSPFKANCLLLDVSTPGQYRVRAIGERFAVLIDHPVAKGHDLSEIGEGFAHELVQLLSAESPAFRAAEFEFTEDRVESRGIMLPLSLDGDGVQFLMVVATFRRHSTEGLAEFHTPATPAPAAEAPVAVSMPVADFRLEAALPPALAEAVGEGVAAAKKVVRMDEGGRESLYAALGRALAIYEQADSDPASFEALLGDAGIKAQARAPFTPVLKLVFGKNYDKTRLTEYAAALAHAVKNGVRAEDLPEFLIKMPGGIKGCVREERSSRRRKRGGRAMRDPLSGIRSMVAAMPARRLEDLAAEAPPGDDICLLLARRNDDGELEPLGIAKTDPSQLTAILRRQTFT